jgi:glycosyltransferase involved in cell wall biosynthesis
MAEQSPKISIGLPVYNGEKYLRVALDSILLQDYTDFELIVSDNASSDSTQAICLEYAAKDDRIRYYRSEVNIGASGNFARVVNLARGEYFKWMAHDDVHLQGFLSSCSDVIDRAPDTVALVTPRSEIIDERGVILRDAIPIESLDTRVPQPHRRIGDVFRNVFWAPAQFGLFRIDILKRTRLIQPFAASDYVFLTEVALLGEIWELPEILFQRRVHAGMSTTANKKPRELQAWFGPPETGLGRLVPSYFRLEFQYFRAINRMQFTLREQLLCYLSVITIWYPRRTRQRFQLWRNRLALGTRLKAAFSRRTIQPPTPAKIQHNGPQNQDDAAK